jgi:uncharacterized membrane protein
MHFHGNIALALPHLLAGLVGLGAGIAALTARKGARLHRQSGVVFVWAMMIVAVSGIAMAAISGQKLNLLGGLLTLYMVTTAFITVRRDRGPSGCERFHWIDVAALLFAIAVGAFGISTGIEASRSATGRIDGLPPAPAFIFGGVALLAATGDIRMMVRGVAGNQIIARHLWRMCFAFFSATGSFFPAQVPKMFPSLRSSPLLWIPPLLVLLIMLFSLWRVRRLDDGVRRNATPEKTLSSLDAQRTVAE